MSFIISLREAIMTDKGMSNTIEVSSYKIYSDDETLEFTISEDYKMSGFLLLKNVSGIYPKK